MASEDEVLFPALAAALPAAGASLAPLQVEHRELRGMLAALAESLAASPSAERDEQIAIQVADMAELLRIHIRKEEALVFRVAERVLRPGELQRLADLQAARAAASARPSGAHPMRKGHSR
jgi:hemerythrin-like domain-containing protein